MSDDNCFSPGAFRAERREAGKRMNPDTAILYCRYVMEVDPYGICEDIPEEFRCIGKNWFAFTPETGEVVVQDLPEATFERINERYRQRLLRSERHISDRAGEGPLIVDF